MSLLAPLVLATAITGSRTPAGQEQDALKALAKATYIESGLDKDVKRFEKEFLPDEVRKYGGWVTTIIKIERERQITYEWTF